MTFTIGAWAIPTALTVAVWALAFWKGFTADRGGYFPDIFTPILWLAFSAITSLAGWLIWALWLRGEG